MSKIFNTIFYKFLKITLNCNTLSFYLTYIFQIFRFFCYSNEKISYSLQTHSLAYESLDSFSAIFVQNVFPLWSLNLKTGIAMSERTIFQAISHLFSKQFPDLLVSLWLSWQWGTVPCDCPYHGVFQLTLCRACGLLCYISWLVMGWPWPVSVSTVPHTLFYFRP